LGFIQKKGGKNPLICTELCPHDKDENANLNKREEHLVEGTESELLLVWALYVLNRILPVED